MHKRDAPTRIAVLETMSRGLPQKMLHGPMAGLLGRAVVVIGADGNVVYVELVPEIATEPNYDAALAAVS